MENEAESDTNCNWCTWNDPPINGAQRVCNYVCNGLKRSTTES